MSAFYMKSKTMLNSIPSKTIIAPKRGWVSIDFGELWRYKELLYFLTKRDIKVRYKQTILGGLWAVIQPLSTMIVFVVFFGRMAKIQSDGIPYPIFVYAGLLPWTYFTGALSASSNSLVENVNLITKIYFPRIIAPASAALAGLLDFAIAALILGVMMVYYQYIPGPEMLLLPFLIGMVFVCAVGVGLWLSALNVQYRDIRYVVPLLVQLWMFVSPVIYPISMVPKKYHLLVSINPMVGTIEALRASLLGHQPINWLLLGISAIIISFIFLSGIYYFRRMERVFADMA